MRSALAVVGLQWGDEGKGKVVDCLASNADYAVRFQGGNNAGHTITIGGNPSILHLIPSGVFNPGVTCLIGQGVVLNPRTLLEEIAALESAGIDASGRVCVSSNCTLILPYHIALDEAREACGGKIGTTKRGIGPAHEDKVGRRALRLRDLFGDDLAGKLDAIARYHNHMLREMHKAQEIDPAKVREDLESIAPRLLPLTGDIAGILRRAAADGKRILLEGAQGALLDCEHGTYPYVTSSSCLASAAVSGTGVDLAPRVLGVAKAYATRVGNGPFPTELDGELGERLLRIGKEYGATTGRQRRCGWLDIPALRYAMRLNGCSDLCLTKIDVLDALDEIRICTRYEGAEDGAFPVELLESAQTRPIYETLPGWSEPTDVLKSFEDAPPNMRRYVSRVEELCEARVEMVSVGAGREQTLMREPAGFS